MCKISFYRIFVLFSNLIKIFGLIDLIGFYKIRNLNILKFFDPIDFFLSFTLLK